MFFFLLQIWIFFFWKKQNKFQFGFFSSEKIQIYRRKKKQIRICFFFSEKKNQICKFVFFFRKKNPNLKEKKKPRKKFSKLKFGFFHMDGPLVFFFVFFSPSNLDFFSEKKNQIFIFFYFRKKNQIWIWSFSLMNLDFFWRKLFLIHIWSVFFRKNPNS